MRQADQAVRLTAAVLGVKTDHRGHFATNTGDPLADRLEQFLEASGRVRVPEEDSRVSVFFGGRAVYHLGQIGGKLLVFGCTGLNIRSRLAGFEDKRQGAHNYCPLIRW
ncbi:MAG: hypothetical protein ACC628_02775 [Pirellulaceae bacterium]